MLRIANSKKFEQKNYKKMSSVLLWLYGTRSAGDTFLGSFLVLPFDRFLPTGGLVDTSLFLARDEGSGLLEMCFYS